MDLLSRRGDRGQRKIPEVPEGSDVRAHRPDRPPAGQPRPGVPRCRGRVRDGARVLHRPDPAVRALPAAGRLPGVPRDGDLRRLRGRRDAEPVPGRARQRLAGPPPRPPRRAAGRGALRGAVPALAGRARPDRRAAGQRRRDRRDHGDRHRAPVRTARRRPAGRRRRALRPRRDRGQRRWARDRAAGGRGVRAVRRPPAEHAVRRLPGGAAARSDRREPGAGDRRTPRGAPAYRPQRLSLPPAARSEFTGAAIGVFGAFAISGLFMALAPSLLAHELHQPSRLLAGIAPFTMLGSAGARPARVGPARHPSAAAVRVRLDGRRPGAAGGGGVHGLAAVVLRRERARGGGVRPGLPASVGTVAALADDLTRGEVLAALFLAAYAGLVLPVLLVGLAMLVASGAVVLAGFVVLELALLGWSARRTLARA